VLTDIHTRPTRLALTRKHSVINVKARFRQPSRRQRQHTTSLVTLHCGHRGTTCSLGLRIPTTSSCLITIMLGFLRDSWLGVSHVRRVGAINRVRDIYSRLPCAEKGIAMLWSCSLPASRWVRSSDLLFRISVFAGWGVEAGVCEAEAFDRPASEDVRLDNLVDIGFGDVTVPDGVRVDHNVRAVLALVEAA